MARTYWGVENKVSQCCLCVRYIRSDLVVSNFDVMRSQFGGGDLVVVSPVVPGLAVVFCSTLFFL